jgi:hypothetical protein
LEFRIIEIETYDRNFRRHPFKAVFVDLLRQLLCRVICRMTKLIT